MSTLRGYHEYIEGISWVHRGDIMSTSRGYHEYIEGISWVHRGMFSTSEGYHDVHVAEYHEYIGGCSVHRSFQNKRKAFINLLPHINNGIPHMNHGIPHMNHDLPSMYWTYPDVLKISPQCSLVCPTWIMISLPMYWTSPDVLMISPWCTYDIPLMYLWYPPDVIMVSPDVMNIPRMSWTSPDVLNTLCRVVSGFSLVGGLRGPPHVFYVPLITAVSHPTKSKNCPSPIFVDHDKNIFRYFFNLCMAKANLTSTTS